MKRIAQLAGAFMALAFTGFFIAFIFINLLLGCESWDESYWTEYNSCLTPTMIWEGITE